MSQEAQPLTLAALQRQHYADSTSAHYAHDHIHAFPPHPLDPHPPQDPSTPADQGGRLLRQRSASVADDDEELPIHVPHYPTCPHTEVLDNDAQVDEWVAARAMEFAFTKHGERKPRKLNQEHRESGKWFDFSLQTSHELTTSWSTAKASSEPQPATALLGAVDPALGGPQGPIHEQPVRYQTSRSAVDPTGLLSPTQQEMRALTASAKPHALHISASDTQGSSSLDGSFARFPMKGQGITGGSDSSTAVESKTRRGGRGTIQYESIVEYRCCWSGTYRPRAYANKTGQKRQRAPSTKVGCKARFVIRKMSKTGQYNVTYHWQHNGHDPTDLEQIKRMRSNQLAAPIKEHIRRKNEAASRRSREQQAAAQEETHQTESAAADSTDDGRSLKRKRDLRQVQDHAGPMSTYRIDDNSPQGSPPHAAYLAQPPGSLWESFADRQAEHSRSPLMVEHLRTTATADDTTVNPTLGKFTLNRASPQPQPNVGHGPEPGLQPVDHSGQTDVHHHQQQMLMLIPAPQSMAAGILTGTACSTDGATVRVQYPLPTPPRLRPPMTGQPAARSFHPSQQQLSGLQTPTKQASFQHVGQLFQDPADGSLAVDDVDVHLPPLQHESLVPLSQVYQKFRESLNMVVIRAHGTLIDLEQQSLGIPGGIFAAGSGERQQQEEDVQTRLELLDAVRLGEEFTQRVQAVAQRLKTRGATVSGRREAEHNVKDHC